ncbi:MAG: sugar ABC transporter ATP-binding protein, partial [Atopobiaceae bacterium]|nr:sugar ABC transporter ATP-binding protein [Atopobiaceae bacterium]
MAQDKTPFLRMEGICKSFGGVKALKNVDFEAASGEVHALMGENGAGKSTLIKILAGAYGKDEGKIFIGGEEASISKPKDALQYGVSVIYQEMALIGHLTVAENIMIDEISSSRRVDWKHIQERSAELLDRLGFPDIDVSKPCMSLPVAYQQVVEIAKALSRNAKILVFDEPTAVLTNKEVDKLFEVIENLRREGTCILYVSHRLEEIFRICDRISILKDGAYVGTVEVASISKDDLVTMMVGRELTDMYPERHATLGDVMLEVKNLNSGDMVHDVSFSVRAGEVLG